MTNSKHETEMSLQDNLTPQIGIPHPVTGLDMSVVSDARVAEALPQLLTEWRMKKRWDDMPPQTRALHQKLLIGYLTTGAPPGIAGLNPAILEDLQQRDLIVLRDGALQSAYPFSTRKTGHKVRINGITNFCVCAIDALGAPAMAEKAAQVALNCAVCDAAITVRIGGAGLELQQAAPKDARIWAGIIPIKGCAADTQCQSMLAFCGDQHLNHWRGQQPGPTNGFAFSIAQALQAGAAIFRPFLQKGTAPT
ncbi:hypothetical protein MNBD_ALPHA07-1033 [hydrothermal vent metagenome]|uniref:Alkylmercury lyase n=1 Tax=hydrothermal vent metagenome TaxID=652676 RepID=A0A3B0RWV2_9ZZZZ